MTEIVTGTIDLVKYKIEVVLVPRRRSIVTKASTTATVISTIASREHKTSLSQGPRILSDKVHLETSTGPLRTAIKVAIVRVVTMMTAPTAATTAGKRGSTKIATARCHRVTTGSKRVKATRTTTGRMTIVAAACHQSTAIAMTTVGTMITDGPARCASTGRCRKVDMAAMEGIETGGGPIGTTIQGAKTGGMIRGPQVAEMT